MVSRRKKAGAHARFGRGAGKINNNKGDLIKRRQKCVGDEGEKNPRASPRRQRQESEGKEQRGGRKGAGRGSARRLDQAMCGQSKNGVCERKIKTSAPFAKSRCSKAYAARLAGVPAAALF